MVWIVQVGFTLLIVTALFLGVLFITPFLDRRYSRKWRMIVWILLMVRLVYPFDLSIPDISLTIPFQVQSTGDGGFVNEGTEASEAEDADLKPQTTQLKSDADTEKITDSKRRFEREQHLTYTEDGKVSYQPAVNEKAETTKVFYISEILFFVMAVIYLSGCLFMLLYKFPGWIVQGRRLKRWRLLVRNEMDRNVLEEERKALNIRKKVPLYSSPIVSSPMVVGVFRPAVYLPENGMVEIRRGLFYATNFRI